MQLCCRIRLELSEQIIPAKGSQEPLPNGGSADKAAFSEMIMEAELLMPCEQGCAACGMCRSCPLHLAGGLVSSHPCELPAPRAKIKARRFFVIVPTFLPGALGCKGRDQISFLLSKHFDPIFHITQRSPQAGTKQVSAASAPALVSAVASCCREHTQLLWLAQSKLPLANLKC